MPDFLEINADLHFHGLYSGGVSEKMIPKVIGEQAPLKGLQLAATAEKGLDINKIKKIRAVLRKNPQGLWIREIARKVKIPKSTVHIYINKYMQNEIEDIIKVKGKLIRLVRLER